MEIYKHAHKLNEIVMVRMKVLIYIVSILLFSIITGTAAGKTLINGTNIYITTGEPMGLEQGYVLVAKSVSNDGSVWLQLIDDDKIVKSEIVRDYGYFMYNKTNTTILSIKIEKIYSGSVENLVALSVYQVPDPDKPVPDRTKIRENPEDPGNDSSLPRVVSRSEVALWPLGIALIVILFYALRKLW
ncbi:MAG: hypothetical protein FIB08_11170 [Candidatus Methanoperedens sp.]|nr:hypothetical protein [Candidatus Methanoperedens sp.]